MSKERKVKINATGKEIIVYRHRERNTWVSTVDFDTEYKPDELTFL